MQKFRASLDGFWYKTDLWYWYPEPKYSGIVSEDSSIYQVPILRTRLNSVWVKFSSWRTVYSWWNFCIYDIQQSKYKSQFCNIWNVLRIYVYFVCYVQGVDWKTIFWMRSVHVTVDESHLWKNVSGNTNPLLSLQVHG